MSRKHDERPFGNLAQLVHEDRASLLEVPDHVDVVHDLLSHEDRRSVTVQSAFHDLDGPFHAGAEGSRPGQEDATGAGRRGPGLEGGRGPAERPIGLHATRRGGQRMRPQIAAGDVDDGTKHGQWPAVRGRREPRRLHVHGERSGVGQGEPFVPRHDVVHRDDGAAAGRDAAAGEGRQEHAARRKLPGAVRSANLRRHHDVSRTKAGVEGAAEPRDGHGAGRSELERGGGSGRLGPAHPAPDHPRLRESRPHGSSLDGERRQDQQPVAVHVVPPRYRPSAVIGKTRRYRW